MPFSEQPTVVHIVHSLDGGGTERTLVALLRAFDHCVFRHRIVTLRAAGPLSARLPVEVACRAIGRTGRSRLTGLTLARIVHHDRAAVIHARNTGCWADAVVARTLTPYARLVLGFHGLESDAGFHPRQRRLARWASRVGSRFLSVSEAGRRQLRDQVDIPPDRIDVLPNGVDLRRFGGLTDTMRMRLRRELGFDESAFVVGIVGSLTPVKGHTTLIRAVDLAVDSVPAIRLLIVGDGPLRASLSQQARTCGIADRVQFTGWREDVPDLLGCMDVYVCSSASEGMNNALLEAMAVGLPIIATDVGDNAIMLRDRNEGCIVEPGSAMAIADALRTLFAQPDARRRLAAAARAHARDFDFDCTVRAYEAYYRSLLAPLPVARPPRV